MKTDHPTTQVHPTPITLCKTPVFCRKYSALGGGAWKNDERLERRQSLPCQATSCDFRCWWAQLDIPGRLLPCPFRPGRRRRSDIAPSMEPNTLSAALEGKGTGAQAEGCAP